MNKSFSILCFFFLAIAHSLWAGEVNVKQVYSPAMHRSVETVVVSPTHIKGSCPVIYLLHGAGSDNRKWLTVKPDLANIADSLGVIFVTPEAHNSWYFDSPIHKDVRYETFVSSELVKYVDDNYPTYARRQGRAIMGLSMGGHGALFIAFRHKDVFGACGSMSGGVDFRPFPDNWGIKDELGERDKNQKVWDEHVVVNNIDGLNNQDLSIIIDCGESDFFLEGNKSLHQKLLDRGIDHDFITRPGGHNDQYWANSFDYQMLFFKKFFSHLKN